MARPVRRVFFAIGTVAFLSGIVERFRGSSRWLRLGAFLLLVVAIMLLAAIYTLPDPVVRSVLRAETEFLRVTVANPAVAGFRVGRMRAIPDAAGTGPCIAGLLTPAAGMEVSLLRVGTGSLVIRLGLPETTAVEPDDAATPELMVGTITSADDVPAALRGPHRFVDDAACPQAPTARLAIHGDAEFGREMGLARPTREVAEGYLSEGSLSIFVHSVDSLLGIFRLPSRIYQVQQIAVPAGARLSAMQGPRQPGNPVWWGIARVDPARAGMSIEASTQARNIRLVVPGSESGGSTFRIGDFFHLAEDPNVFWIYTILSAILAMVIATSTEWIGRLVDRLAAWFRPVEPSCDLPPQAPPPQAADAAPSGRPGALALLLATTLGTGAAWAEPVRLTVGADEFGQGWMFRDATGGCRIVTAAHVITRGGRLVAPMATDRSGRELPTAAPVQPEPALDLAFLEARPARDCATRGLDNAGAGERLQTAAQGFLEIVGMRNVGTVPLLRRARSMDEDGGRIIVFERALASTSIVQGMSGGAVLDGAGELIGIIIDTDRVDNQARVIRIDVAATLLATRVLSRAPIRPAMIAGLTAVHGRTVDPGRSLSQLLEGGAGWEVAPNAGFVVVDVRLDQPRRVSGLRLRVDERARGRVGDVELWGSIAADNPPGNWPPLAVCQFPPGSDELYCRFAPRNVLAMRVQLRSPAGVFSLEAFNLLD